MVVLIKLANNKKKLIIFIFYTFAKVKIKIFSFLKNFNYLIKLYYSVYINSPFYFEFHKIEQFKHSHFHYF